jgi:hypothetical protein
VGRDKHKRQRRSRGNFIMVSYSMMDSPAWRDLSGTAVKLLLHLVKLSEGNNGYGHKDEPGELFLGERDAADAIGVARNTVSKAFEELIEHGFLRAVRRGHFKVKIRLATVWRLTFQPYPRARQGPTNEFLKWQPEQNSRAQLLKGTGSEFEHEVEFNEFTGLETAPVQMENGEKPPIQEGSKTAPHLDMPEGGGGRERAPRSNPLHFTPDSTAGRFAPGKAAA